MTSKEDENLLFSDRLCLIIIGDLQKLVGLSWTISDYLGLSRTISDYLGLSRTISDYLRLSQTISDYF